MGKRDTDQAIITGILKGDQKVLNTFYKDNVKYIQGYVLCNSGTTEDVEDVFQDALLKLYQKIKAGTLQIHVPLKTYFYGICKNTWRSRLRKNEKLVIDHTIIDNKKEITDAVVQTIESKEREHLYQKHFQKLSNENKCLMLLYFEGKSAREISQITGFSEGHTRKKKFDVKKRLLTTLKKDPAYHELKFTA